MRRVARALLRGGTLRAPPRGVAPALDAAAARALASSAPAAATALEARGSRAAAAPPAGWAASVLEVAADSLSGAGHEEEEDDDDGLDDDESLGSRRRRRGAAADADADDELEEEDGVTVAELRNNTSRLAWPPPPEALAANPKLAEMMALARADGAESDAAAQRLARVRAVVLRVLDQALPKLPMTARPSFNRGLLCKCSHQQIREHVDALGLLRRGDESRDALVGTMLEYILDTPSVFPETAAQLVRGSAQRPRGGGAVEEEEGAASSGPRLRPSKLRVGMRLPESAFARRAHAATSGAVVTAQRPPDPLRDRHAYPQLVEAADMARLLAAAHADDVAIIHLGGRCTWADSFVIGTARSPRHLDALAGAVLHHLKQALEARAAAGARGGAGDAPSVEGRASAETPEWLLVDAGSVVVHLFTASMRRDYNLEELWGAERGCRVELYRPGGAGAVAGAGGAHLVSAADAGAGGEVAAGAPPAAERAAAAGGAAWQEPAVFDAAARSALAAARAATAQESGSGVAPEAAAAAAVAAAHAAASRRALRTAPRAHSAEDALPLASEGDDEKVQLSALARYEAALAADTAREAARQARQERRAAEATAVAARCAEERAAARRIKKKPPRAPPPSVQLSLVAAALTHGFHYGGTLPRHAPTCGCEACAFARPLLEGMYPEAAVAARLPQPPPPPACALECRCDRCAWMHWRVGVHLSRTRLRAAAAGIPFVVVGRQPAQPPDPAALESVVQAALAKVTFAQQQA